MKADLSRAATVLLGTAATALVLGGAGLVLGVGLEAPLLWGFGLACLLSVAPSFALGLRVRWGLGNRGLDGERRTLRITGHLLRLLALLLAIASVLAWTDGTRFTPGAAVLTLSGAATVIWLGLWSLHRPLADLHPSLALAAARTRTLAELAGLVLAGSLLGLLAPWAGSTAGLALALRIFLAGRAVGQGTSVSLVGCGGCGSCGCG